MRGNLIYLSFLQVRAIRLIVVKQIKIFFIFGA
jgi:hypothetical protein